MPARDVRERSSFAGRLAVLTQILFAAILGGLATVLGREPGFLPRGLVLFAIFSLPAVVGWVGIRRGRSALLLAAAVATFFSAFVAFSGVTLILLIPAILLLAAAIELEARPAHSRSLGGALVQLIAAVAIVALYLGAGASALLVTDAACWSYSDARFGTKVQTFPYTTGEIMVPIGASGSSCSTGLISLRGAGAGVLLAGAALGVASLAARRPRASRALPSEMITR